MPKIDLKSYPFVENLFGKTLWGYTDVYRTISFQSGYGFHAVTYFPLLRSQISRRLQSKKIYLSRPVPLYGFRPNYIQRKPPRYRGLLTLAKQKALPHGHPEQSIQVNPCRCQRKSRLENICRVSSNTHRDGSRSLQSRFLPRRAERNNLRPGCNNYRSLSFSVPLGNLSQNKSSDQTSYTVGSQRQHPNIHPYLRWQAARCQRPGYSPVRGWGFLCHGSRLPGLRAPLLFYSRSRFFCHQSQNEYQVQKNLLPPCRPVNGTDMRSNSQAYRVEKQKNLPSKTSSSKISRPGNRQSLCISNQQFHSACINYNLIVSLSVAGRVVFQMDQAAPANQEFFRNIPKRSEVSNLDSYLRLCARRHNEEASQPPRKPLHNFTDFKCLGFRKSCNLSANYRKRSQSTHCLLM